MADLLRMTSSAHSLWDGCRRCDHSAIM